MKTCMFSERKYNLAKSWNMRRYFKSLCAWMLYTKPYRMLLTVMVKGFIVAMLCMIYTIY